MPEGDTIYRTARTLERALAGRIVTAFETVLPALARVDEDAPIAGRTIVSARSVGKHLLIDFSARTTEERKRPAPGSVTCRKSAFSDAVVLRTHMRMNGSWHIYRPGERWLKPRPSMRVVIVTDDYVAVGFDIPVAEFVVARNIGRHAELSRLGPDLLGESFDEAAVVARLRAARGPSIADALLDQRVMAGIGNVFKSEILFVCGIDPFRPVHAVSEDDARTLVRAARELLRANVVRRVGLPIALRGYRQTTRSMNPEARLWVYGRGGKACRRCGTPVNVRKQGEDARLTYWCPRCQA